MTQPRESYAWRQSCSAGVWTGTAVLLPASSLRHSPHRDRRIRRLSQPVWREPAIGDFAQRPLGYGHSLPVIYAIWILAVGMLYAPCLWFMEFRSRHRDWALLD